MAISIPPWPSPESDEGAKFFANAKAVFAAFKAKGAGNPAALAMVAMAEAESSLDPDALGDYVDAAGKPLRWMAQYPPGATPTAFGLFQWHMSRLNAIRAQTGVDIASAVLAGRGDAATQAAAAWWELTHGPGYGLKAIESASTAYGAAMQATALFEKAGALDAAERRGRMAERWAAWFQKEM